MEDSRERGRFLVWVLIVRLFNENVVDQTVGGWWAVVGEWQILQNQEPTPIWAGKSIWIE